MEANLRQPMQLTLQSEMVEDVIVIRCKGRIVLGPEINALQEELKPLTQLTKKVVLHVGEVTFIDSAGVGALVRTLGGLRAYGGDLKLCEVSPIFLQILTVTNLIAVLPNHASQDEAMQAFSSRPRAAKESLEAAKTRIVCADGSQDLLAYLSALLKRSGYEVMTTQHRSEALTLVRATKPHILICGPGIHADESAMAGFRRTAPKMHFLPLPADFSTSDAGQAGTNLVNQVHSLVASGS